MLILYLSKHCVYCQKVVSAFEEQGTEYEAREVNTPEEWKQLEELGGKMQIPYLVDQKNNVSMYESEDIIQYVKKIM